MDVNLPLQLLGGLSPQQFMNRHWERKPLLVRQALPGFSPLLPRAELFALAERDDVESRLVSQKGDAWQFQRGPFPRRALPPLKRSHWTLLVQGVDLYHDAVHQLMQQFRFVPDARLDDLMISYATDQGGVGPHYDSYDVFLIQAHGQRRWRIGRQKDLSLRDDVPLKILSHFEWEHEYVLNPGDMLYLPPQYAHDGVALGECMTYSVGFRSPYADELAREVLQRVSEQASDLVGVQMYRDPKQPAVAHPGAIPPALQDFARKALEKALRDPLALARSLGEYLTEPKSNVWFEARVTGRLDRGLRLDAGTRMMYDERHVFINGESFLASGRDARLMQGLCDHRELSAAEWSKASAGAQELLQSWCEAGWLHGR